jgi:F-type H+-transporting ATPase subunit epsilon
MSENLPGSLHLKVITPRSLLVDADVEAVTLPSLEGYLGILPGHRPLFTALGKGDLAYRLDKREERIPVRGGYAEVQPASVLVFSELSQDEDSSSPLG